MTQNSSTLAKYSQGGPVGILPGQSMFATGTNGSGVLDAKSSFVRMLNLIFARNPIAIDRAQAVELLSVESPIDPYLIWRQPTGTNHVEVIPPQRIDDAGGEWDYQVYSVQERDQLLADPSLIQQLLSGGSFRVLLNGLGNPEAPQWSVWKAKAEVLDENGFPIIFAPSDEIFENWARFNGADYFETVAEIPNGNEALSWTMVDGQITATVNSAYMIGFISPTSYSKYHHTITVSSTNGDDDMIGLVIAFAVVGGVPHSLMAIRNNGGYAGAPNNWAIVEVVGQTRTVLVSGNFPSTPPFAYPNGANNGWVSSGPAIIDVVRDGNTITCKTSQFGTSVLDNTTMLTYEIQPGSPYYDSAPVGYAAESQSAASFFNSFDGGYLADNPGDIYSLCKSYDFHVETFHDRDLLKLASTPIAVGQRVLVDGSTTTSGFWTVWEYMGNTAGADVDAAGFQLVRYQTYRTSDFWNTTDWYATGYSKAEPPVVRYATQKDRDVAENPTPKTKFVRVDDDGTGSWIWTTFVDSSWVIVARQNGTIEFSSKFYDATNTVQIGFDPVKDDVLSSIGQRDGSWEFRVLYDLLQDVSLLTKLEVNELFFSMLHFVHAQQDQVAWAFKTSFLSVGGYNEVLTETPVQPIDNTTNLLNYLDEVKPYRVKTRGFTRIVTPNIDNINLHGTDFDFPMYYDPETAKYRYLDLNNANDAAIIKTRQPWKDWFDNYTKPETRPTSYVAAIWNGVRHMNFTLDFDRVDHMPLLASEDFIFNSSIDDPFTFHMAIDTTLIDMRVEIVEVFVDGVRLRQQQYVAGQEAISLFYTPAEGAAIRVNVRKNLSHDLAADRIQRFYDPTNLAAAEKNLRTLMGLTFKGNVLLGGDLSNNDLRDYDITGGVTGASEDEFINPDGDHFGLADPAHEEDRPEELIVTATGESLRIINFDSTTNTTVAISTARPGTDLMAPKETGDFDARPLEQTLYDHGVAEEQGRDPEDVNRNLYVLRSDAFEFTPVSNVGGTLAQPLIANSNTIVINVSGGMPFTLPVVEELAVANSSVVETITKPGVVWINSERIEFFNYTAVANTVTLSEIRRGTHNTRIGVERRYVVRVAGDGTSKSFGFPTSTLPLSPTEIGDLTVTVNEPLRKPDGTVITVDGYTGYNINVPKRLDTDYTLAFSSGTVNITFNVAPPKLIDNSIQPGPLNNIYFAKTVSPVHLANSKVFDGAYSYNSPIVLP